MVGDGEDKPTDALNTEVVANMVKFCYKVSEHDLARAKNILKNQILSQYEGRLSDVCEEIGKQILFFGRRPSVAEMFARVDTITPQQVMAVAQKYIFDKDPFICSIGKALWALDYNMVRNQTYQWKQ
jgi:mitochondrial-processing peptidase subunit beta